MRCDALVIVTIARQDFDQAQSLERIAKLQFVESHDKDRQQGSFTFDFLLSPSLRKQVSRQPRTFLASSPSQKGDLSQIIRVVLGFDVHCSPTLDFHILYTILGSRAMEFKSSIRIPYNHYYVHPRFENNIYPNFRNHD